MQTMKNRTKFLCWNVSFFLWNLLGSDSRIAFFFSLLLYFFIFPNVYLIYVFYFHMRIVGCSWSFISFNFSLSLEIMTLGRSQRDEAWLFTNLMKNLYFFFGLLKFSARNNYVIIFTIFFSLSYFYSVTNYEAIKRFLLNTQKSYYLNMVFTYKTWLDWDVRNLCFGCYYSRKVIGYISVPLLN